MFVNEYTPALLFQEAIEELAKQANFYSHTTKVHPRWKKILNAMEPLERKEFFLQSIIYLRDDKNQPNKILNLCLRVLQDLALSPRVSNLNSLKYYIRKVDGGNHHPLLLKGIKTFLTTLYPEETIYFIDEYTELTDELLPEDQKSCWIVLQPQEKIHQILMRVFQENSNICLETFDSTGFTPLDPVMNSDLQRVSVLAMKRITKLISKNGPYIMRNIFVRRQGDTVNCSSFICEDMRTARNLLKENKPLFVNRLADQSFFKMSQNIEHIKGGLVDPEMLRDEKSDTKFNIKATLIAMDIFELFIDKKVEFPPVNYTTEEKSEEDTKDCVIA